MDAARREKVSQMQEVIANARTIRELLDGAKFEVDYYQREYRWTAKQVDELLNDLSGVFLDDYRPEQEPSAVKEYGHYFLGSVIISSTGARRFIVDGQQRLTTLTLLLMHLYRELEDKDDQAQVSTLIFSRQFGKNSFNMNVPERVECMQALFDKKQPNVEGKTESISNIVDRFEQIQSNISLDEETSEEGEPRIDRAALPYFTNWLLEKVYMVEITALSDADAYTIFETMNDRGLSLTPTEMLKGYLLTNIKDDDSRAQANDIWKRRITALQELGKEEDADAIKAWLRSQHALEIRERSRGAQPKDFDRIGTEFHRWVRDNEDALGLKASHNYTDFIKADFEFYTKWHQEIRLASQRLTPGMEAVRFNASNNFTLQDMVLLAPIEKTDSETEIRKKIRITAMYLDGLIARRIWNQRNFGYSAMSYAMFRLIRAIRHMSVDDLAEDLEARTLSLEDFSNNRTFGLHERNGPKIHYLLARITDHVGVQAGEPSRYDEYMQRGRSGYEIEHIWSIRERGIHEGEYNGSAEYHSARNRIGGLLLLPKSFNASYGAKPYAEKYPHYFGQNLLAASLNELAYANNPRFKEFVASSGLPFRAHTEFNKADNDARQELYLKIVEQIWDPENLVRVAEE